jgi:hypothetical protein
VSMFEMGWHMWGLRRAGKQPKDCACKACLEWEKYWDNFDYFPLHRELGFVKPCSESGSCSRGSSAGAQSCR